ncbi:MAG: ATP-binding protein [Angustibacter sp.]
MTPLPPEEPHLDDLPDGLVLADESATITHVNREAERVLDRSRAELLGVDVREALPFHDTEGGRWWSCTDPWGGLPTRTGHRERLLLLPGDGAPRQVLVTARYQRPAPTHPVHRVLLGVRDAKARERAQQDHGALIATVAHELRSPLTSVKGFTATLLRRWDRFTDDQKRFMLETIEHDADRVTRLISELLDISRIDAGRLEVRKQPLDLGAIANRYVERMRAGGHEGREFDLRVGESVPQVWADPDRMDQVFANLMENAVRHGDGQVTVEVQACDEALSLDAEPEPVVCVIVSDQGEGIPESDLQRVFTRFWHSNRRGGTGLGLYLVRGLVEAHGGRIYVSRPPEGGARFTFSLPSAVPEHLS